MASIRKPELYLQTSIISSILRKLRHLEEIIKRRVEIFPFYWYVDLFNQPKQKRLRGFNEKLEFEKCKQSQFFHTFLNLSFTKKNQYKCMYVCHCCSMHGHLNRWTYIFILPERHRFAQHRSSQGPPMPTEAPGGPRMPPDAPRGLNMPPEAPQRPKYAPGGLNMTPEV